MSPPSKATMTWNARATQSGPPIHLKWSMHRRKNVSISLTTSDGKSPASAPNIPVRHIRPSRSISLQNIEFQWQGRGN
jgi:hypothetical protein